MSRIPILFGTETGNAEYCANELSTALKKAGYRAQVIDMGTFQPSQLTELPFLLIVTSTYGQGDPPANAEKLLRYLENEHPFLGQLRYGVCAFGDSTYQNFAQCGRDFDRLFEDCGATRALDLHVCDIDFEDTFPAFQQSVLSWAETQGAAYQGVEEEPEKKGFFQRIKSWFGRPADASLSAPDVAPPKAHQGQAARVLRRRRLNQAGSHKETMHYELSLEGTGITYEPGDCIAVHPENHPAEVEQLLQLLGLPGDAPVTVNSAPSTLREALLTRDLQRVSSKWADLLAQRPGPLSQPGTVSSEYRARRYLIEAISEHTGPFSLDAQTVIDWLLPLPPRLYSVASSPRLNAQEVHLTVETPRYAVDKFQRVGLASAWLCDRVQDGDSILVHHVPGPHFHLPEAHQDIILVGPGTGIAPFRAFLQEREATQASGRTWLFFGHQHREQDFLYEEELKGFLQRGVLARLDCAWSRDQAEKQYVQHLMKESASALWQWLNAGAVLYVCGDKQHMASDVRQTLVAIAEAQGQLDPATAEAWVAHLEQTNRYRLDVY